MAKERKDSNGKKLKKGESQRSDGRYEYRYTYFGERYSVYARTLTELQRKEAEIQNKLYHKLDPAAADRMTLNDMFDRYIKNKRGIEAYTKANYIYMYDHFVRERFGKQKIGRILYEDIKQFYFYILDKYEISINTLDNIHTVIKPTFELAVKNRILDQNPCFDVLKDVKQSYKLKPKKRQALSLEEQESLKNFLFNHREKETWRIIITVLLGTGLRIGECVALRWEDVDFDRRKISVNIAFVNRQCGNGHAEKHITMPKTVNSIREIPMSDEVYDALKNQWEIRSCIGFCEEELDGYSGFVFANARNGIFSPPSINGAIDRIIEGHNKEEIKYAAEEGREPLLLPDFSAHVLRHTFCTRMVEQKMSLPELMKIMGHASITTTIDIYTSISPEMVQKELARIEKIGYNQSMKCLD